jgi:putative transposase
VVQRGNNKVATFYSQWDYVFYLDSFSEAANKFGVDVHAYVLMTNHVHLLVTPHSTDGLSLMMQALGRRFVSYFNKKHGRTGTLWEGRFKSSVVDSDVYCLACYRYIELNPLRAGLVRNPVDYQWSSYRHNALGHTNSLITHHESYLQLDTTVPTRRSRYRTLVASSVDHEYLDDIRHGIKKGLPVGSDEFRVGIDRKLGKRLGSGKIGRPAKTRAANK